MTYSALLNDILTPALLSASKENQAPNPPSQKGPHSWTLEQKTKLLELIVDYTQRGHATDNSNLKRDAWAAVTKDLNATFDISLDLQQLQNQKAEIRKVYQDFKFLREQSGFGWNKDLATPTADPKTWDELCSAHPKQHFNKLKGKSFSLRLVQPS
ncbi:uncharacterized protein PGTG_12591 [Puccinia graminis f. sp. tritici CRL 75-36-700-3]|uniref:Myb/SANT-like domain-containing protein n=1 Tax=Puccinia graminis f. sp. tritici (strain CRL 75-36-700-3 / race SCCL) TaxID=418459 RepID=E3KUT4_PUCGT|nr:uncharacterized protein PGTG_12591 [Puccinia graminis f. sp. tritici CRL 75-36-700-3]EFP88144.2 hypothetical protein PGTG_12591 [Puccinia graminis f. sp. tritici CRL 75-36-700-3]